MTKIREDLKCILSIFLCFQASDKMFGVFFTQKSIPNGLHVHSLGHDFHFTLIYNISCKEE